MTTWQSWVRNVPELILVSGVTAIPMGVALVQRRAV